MDNDSTAPPASIASRTSSVKGDNARLLSQATSTAVVAARSILMNGGSEATALKTAKAAAQSVLAPSSGENESVSSKSASFLRRRKAKRQAEVVASMALVSATNSLNANGAAHGNLDWENMSVRSGVSHLTNGNMSAHSNSNGNHQMAHGGFTPGGGGFFTQTPTTTNRQGGVSGQGQHNGNNAGGGSATLQSFFATAGSTSNAAAAPPPPPPRYPQASSKATYGNTEAQRHQQQQQQRDRLSMKQASARSLREEARVPPPSSSAQGRKSFSKPSLPPLSPGRRSSSRVGRGHGSPTSGEKSPRSPVKDIIKRNASQQEEVDVAAKRLVNGQDVVDQIPQSISRVDSTKQDPQGENEDPIYFKDDDSSSSNAGDKTQGYEDETLEGLDMESLMSRTDGGETYLEDMTTYTQQRGQGGNDQSGNSFDSTDSAFGKVDPFLTSFTDAFNIFKCTPFGFQVDEKQVAAKRTNHRGQVVISETRDEGNGRSATVDEGSVLTERSGPEITSVYTDEDGDTMRNTLSRGSTTSNSAADQLQLSSSSEAEIQVQSSFLETLNRVVMGSTSHVFEDRQDDGTAAGGGGATVATAGNKLESQPSMISSRHLVDIQADDEFLRQQEQMTSPRNDPNATVVKKKKKGWFRGRKPFRSSSKKHYQPAAEMDVN